MYVCGKLASYGMCDFGNRPCPSRDVITSGDGEENLEEFKTLIGSLWNVTSPWASLRNLSYERLPLACGGKHVSFVRRTERYASGLTPWRWTEPCEIQTRRTLTWRYRIWI